MSMSGGFIQFTETDYGSKGRAKKATEDLPIEITKEMRWRLRVWWQKVLDTARLLCPVDTGTLQSSIRIEDIEYVPVGFGLAQYPFMVARTPSSELINSMIIAGGDEYINPKTMRGCDYAQAVHDGHFTRGGNFIPPQPFIDMAVDLHIEELESILGQSIDRVVNRVWSGD